MISIYLLSLEFPLFRFLVNGKDWEHLIDDEGKVRYPLCGGTERQSPINIVTGKGSIFTRGLAKLAFSSDYKNRGPFLQISVLINAKTAGYSSK